MSPYLYRRIDDVEASCGMERMYELVEVAADPPCPDDISYPFIS